MDKKIALVFGGTRGIGLETAKSLNDAGFRVGICARKKLSNLNNSYDFYKLDVTNLNSVKEVLSEVIKKYSRIDSIVYSVTGEIKNDTLERLDWATFQDHINVQIMGFFNIVNSLLKIKSENKIKFVVVLTEYCFGKPPVRLAPYITAKYGLMGLVKSMASELSPKKYIFNMVSPGMVNTSLLSNLPAKLIELTAESNPMKRIADPKDVSKIIAFLASEESDYLNGVNIPINGGNIFT